MNNRICFSICTLLLVVLPCCGRSKEFRPDDRLYPPEGYTHEVDRGQTVAVHNPGEPGHVVNGPDQIHLTWTPEEGILRLDGVQIRPAPLQSPQPPDLEQLRGYRERVPRVRQLAGTADDYQTLLEAYMQWNSELLALQKSAADLYASRVPEYPTTDAERETAARAMEGCLAIVLSDTLLVASASVWESGLMLDVRGQGLTLLPLLPACCQITPPVPATRIPEELALSCTRIILTALRTWNPLHLELGGGRLYLDGAPIEPLAHGDGIE